MKIKIYDEFSPEDTAMMQALYSRSAESVDTHIEKVKKTGSSQFAKKFYVQYGHQSIGDCGSTTIFIEDVSILVAKAIQDWPLYRGQETSTRYIDMSKQRIHDPIRTEQSANIHKKWMQFYFSSQEPLAQHLKGVYPIKAGENPATYEKAIKARVFDVLRAFLPAGICTQLSWHTDLRQAADKLFLMKYHPLAEGREVAISILDNLKSKYSSSFSHKEYSATESYRLKSMQKFTYQDPVEMHQPMLKNSGWVMSFSSTIDSDALKNYNDLLAERPLKTNLPYFLSDLGQCSFRFPLDFGSFRDIQRHRNGVCRMPLLTVKGDFHQWYLEEMSTDLRTKAEQLIREQVEEINKLNCSKEDLQYYIAMGFIVNCDVTYGLPAAVYVAELRSGKTVHPTLRQVAQRMGGNLKSRFENLKLYIDEDQDDWDIRRGNQDIIAKL